MATLGGAPSRAVLAEDVGDLQGRPAHEPAYDGGKFSNGLITSRNRSVATCV